ncbi:MAG: sulfurtransferase TusA family protein [Nitrospiraceae bacterium]|jgi:TusA-related sulfurtransferase|nr:MAG: sulfurtransferase TusA family protein [Nitrospiraceae bacterium]
MPKIISDTVIDVRGLACPRPLLKTKQLLSEMDPGQVLHVIANDVTTRSTIRAYLGHSGDKLIKIDEDGAELHHFIKKK